MTYVSFYAGTSMGRARVSYETPKSNSSLTGGTSTKVKDVDRGYTREWAPWGASDNLPTELRKKAQKGDTAPAAFMKRNELIYGKGLFYWKAGEGQDMAVKAHYDQKVEDWLDDNCIREMFLAAQIADFGVYWCCYSEFLLNNRRDYITELHHKTAEFCRLLPVKDTEKVSHIVYSPKFPYPVQSELIKIPLLNRFRWRKQIAENKAKKYGIYTYFHTPGTVFYPSPYHIGLFKKDGWIDYTNATPLMLTKMRQTQAKILYHIRIPIIYFEMMYQGNGKNEESWLDMSDARRREIFEDKAKELENALSGSDNWGKAITSLFMVDESTNEAMPDIDIKVLDHKFKSDEWIPGNENASGTIAQALGVDPTTIGMQKSGLASGSGSDKRVAHNTATQDNTIYQDIILWQLNFVSRFNKWGVRFGFRHHYNVSTDFSKNGVSSTDENHDDNGTV